MKHPFDTELTDDEVEQVRDLLRRDGIITNSTNCIKSGFDGLSEGDRDYLFKSIAHEIVQYPKLDVKQIYDIIVDEYPDIMELNLGRDDLMNYIIQVRQEYDDIRSQKTSDFASDVVQGLANSSVQNGKRGKKGPFDLQ